jgi:hypothetical protein
MGKLAKTLEAGHKGIRRERLLFIEEEMEHKQRRLIDTLKEEKRSIERKLLDLSDLYPESTLSLMVVKKDFDAEQWVQEVQAAKVSLKLNSVKLICAEETFKEWFTEEEPAKFVTE